MSALLDRVVFTVAGVDYRWADVLMAAVVRGDWAELAADVSLGLACAERRELAGELPNGAEADAAAAFRYARRLESACEMRAWLARWDVSASAWMAYVRRVVARAALAGERNTATPDAACVRDAMWCEGACSGALVRFARRLAARLALADGEHASPGDTSAVEVDTVTACLRDALSRGAVPGLDAACCDAGAVAAVRSELILQRLRERIATPEVVAATVAARRIEWIQLDYRMLAFPDAIEAAEAALCAREDGDPLCAVAAACGRPLLATRAFLDEIDACAHDALLAASDGEVVGPLPLRGEHVVIEVLGKRWPSPDEPATAQRARRLVVARALRRAMDERVTWTDWT